MTEIILINILSHTNDIHYRKHQNECDMRKFEFALLQF